MLLPKKPEKMTDEELDKGLKQAEVKQQVLYKHHSKAAPVAACAILLAAYWMVKLAFLTGNPFIVMGALVGGSATLVAGCFAYAIGWTKICNGLTGKWNNDKEKIGKEQKKRAFEKTPAFIEAAIKLKDDIKKAFNDAVDKAFNHGTDKELKVKKPIQLKTAAPAAKKKSIF
jgi:hypothetical protein